MRAAVFALVLVGACDRVPAERHEAVVQERDALKQKVKTLEDDLDKAKGEVAQVRKEMEKTTTRPARPPEAQVAATRSQLKLQDKGRLKATLKTNLGDIVCELFPDIAPETVLNFVGLAEGSKEWTNPEGQVVKKPLYDGTQFHRVIKGFMIQGGDPKGNGTGGPGFNFGDEVWPDVRFEKPGQLAMANAGPGTNGSQFFITVGAPPKHLNGKHTIFGECNPETPLKISEVEVQGSTPVKNVVLEKVTISREGPPKEPPPG